MMNQPLRILFAGTPDFAAHILRGLLDSEHAVIGAYTQPDRPAGRGKKLTASPVKNLALQHALPIYQPLNFKADSDRETLVTLAPDLMIVVAYGLILPQAVLDIPRLGCWNVHASLLPRWRGAAPIQRAIEAGDAETGVTIMQMDAGLDTGAMLGTLATPIAPADTSATLHDRLADLGATALMSCLDQLAQGTLHAEPQDNHLASYAHKLSKDEARLDWNQSATSLARRVQAFNPWPVATCWLGDLQLRIWTAHATTQPVDAAPGTILAADKSAIQVACGAGTLHLTRLQWPGGKPLSASDALNARRDQLAPGHQFG
jgi:methionyl-tRNA formyltransferase